MRNERHISLVEAQDLLPGKPTLPTVHRWASRGVRGVKLESIRCGGRRFTSREAIERFLEALNKPAVTPEYADDELAAEGL